MDASQENASQEIIMLAHGAGGQQTAALIQEVFHRQFANPEFTADDAAVLPFGDRRLAFTTDSFIVSPWKFPGGNIGRLSVCGTVNDLACMGARPRYLSCAFVLEEGLPMRDLGEVVSAMAHAAEEADVRIVAGDTKVAGKGQVDKIFITTTGIGEMPGGIDLSGANARPGDAVIVTGDIGRHGCAILMARGEFGLAADIASDCAPLGHLVQDVLNAAPGIHAIRDATRGGVGTVLYEIASQSAVGIHLDACAIPVDAAVGSVCEMLGLDPLYLACEGRLVMVAAKESVPQILGALHGNPYAHGAAMIGEVTCALPGKIVVTTEIGAETLLPPPSGELLPRIC